MSDLAADFARESFRARRRSLLGLAALLLIVGSGFLALTLWFTDRAHFFTFLTAAACLLAAGAGVLVHGVRLREMRAGNDFDRHPPGSP